MIIFVSKAYLSNDIEESDATKKLISIVRRYLTITSPYLLSVSEAMSDRLISFLSCDTSEASSDSEVKWGDTSLHYHASMSAL